MFLLAFVSILAIARAKPLEEKGSFVLSLVHINDFHARYEETNEASGPCRKGETCIGGYARQTTIIKHLLSMYKNENPVYLNAADNYQGTPWYTKWTWNVTSAFLNMLPADAMTIGNHEFDHGVEGYVPFLRHVWSPVVVANIEEESRRRVFGNMTKPYVVLERNGVKIGVIGLILEKVNEISNTGDLKFLNEVPVARNYVAELKEQGVNIIILLTHCGIERDKEIAAEVEDVDVIVGGHSHTHLYTGKSPGPDVPEDVYPVVVERPSGQKTLIVHTSGHTKYVGFLQIKFDAQGVAHWWTGDPVFVGPDVQPDPEVAKEVALWKSEMNAMEGVVGSTRTLLSNLGCKVGECAIGDFMADSMVYSWKDVKDAEGDPLSRTAILNSGAIRTSLLEGDITYRDLLTLSPFGNTIDMYFLSGKVIWSALEHAVTKKEGSVFRGFLQFSGFKVHYDLSRPIGERAVRAQILNPVSNTYEALDREREYFVIINSFLAKGGDGFTMFRDNATLVQHGVKDSVAVTNYLMAMKNLDVTTESRIVFEEAGLTTEKPEADDTTTHESA